MPLLEHADETGIQEMAGRPEILRHQVVADFLHDLRTPLVALRGYARMLQEERVGPLNDIQRNYLQTITENSQRLVRVLNELSQVAALEPMAFERLSLPALLREDVLAGQEVSRRGIAVEQNCRSLELCVWGDRQQLREALREFIARVAEASEQARLVVTVSEFGSKVHFRISASPEADHSQSMNQERASRTVAHTGSSASGALDRAAGFSAAEAVIILHGGHFLPGSEPRSNTQIEFVLPACSEPFSPASQEKELAK